MRRADFEKEMDRYIERNVTTVNATYTYEYRVIQKRQLRDFIWEVLMKRDRTEWANCDECGVQFPKSTKNQRFHDPICKNRAAQRKRREREDSA